MNKRKLVPIRMQSSLIKKKRQSKILTKIKMKNKTNCLIRKRRFKKIDLRTQSLICKSLRSNLSGFPKEFSVYLRTKK